MIRKDITVMEFHYPDININYKKNSESNIYYKKWHSYNLIISFTTNKIAKDDI